MILGYGQLGSVDAQLGAGYVSGVTPPVLLPDNIIIATLEATEVLRTLTNQTAERTLTATEVIRTLEFDG